ncbi:hypothetical protein HY404_00980 [Candidatus Microgenomates bacterium]|nr:hypothetical protein [Candidatus Microgenomates bacterium]
MQENLKGGENSRIEDLPVPEFNLTDEQKLILTGVADWVSNFFKNAEENNRVVMGGHGFDHNQRTAGIAAVIATREGYSPFLPALTSLIFDIGRTSTDPRAHNFRHGELSREMAHDFIIGLPLADEEKTLVLNAIEDHPKLNDQIVGERRNWLQMILQDADRLDTLGPIGIARASSNRWRLPLFSDQIAIGTPEDTITTSFQDYAYRVPVWIESMWTKTGLEITQARMPYMQAAIAEIRKEAQYMHDAFGKLFE